MDQVLIITALQSEARPFVDHYGLKKETLQRGLFIFEGEKISCFTTGVGPRNVKKRLSSLFKMNEHSRSILVNVGIAGGRKDNTDIGKMYSVNKIMDEVSGRTWFPEMLIKTGLQEMPLTTVVKGVSNGGEHIEGLVDMEGAAIFDIGVQHMNVHQMHFIKVVSDHMDVVLDSPDHVEKLIEGQMPKLIETIELLQKSELVKHPLLDEQNGSLVEQLNEQLKFTETQGHQLKERVEAFIALNSNDLSFLKPFLKIDVNTTAEREKTIKEIHESLSS